CLFLDSIHSHVGLIPVVAGEVHVASTSGHGLDAGQQSEYRRRRAVTVSGNGNITIPCACKFSADLSLLRIDDGGGGGDRYFRSGGSDFQVNVDATHLIGRQNNVVGDKILEAGQTRGQAIGAFLQPGDLIIAHAVSGDFASHDIGGNILDGDGDRRRHGPGRVGRGAAQGR